MIWECKNNNCIITDKTLKKNYYEKNITPLSSLRNLIKKNKLKMPNQIPSISSGLFGYMGYEMIQYFERVILSKENNLELPDSIFIRPSMTLVFDNVNDKLFITRSVSPSDKNPKEVFNQAKNDILNLTKINQSLSKNSFRTSKF